MSVWDEEWKRFKGPNFYGKGLYKAQRSAIMKFMNKLNLKDREKMSFMVLDVGCGTGRTLNWFRENGYSNSKGIDESAEALKHAEQSGFILNKDIFQQNLLKTSFEKHHFDLVFSDGLLEHFENIQPYVDAMCKLSKRYVLITQPNHFSLFGRLLEMLTKKTVHEYSYKLEDFRKAFEKNGFKMIGADSYNFNEQWIILFEKI